MLEAERASLANLTLRLSDDFPDLDHSNAIDRGGAALADALRAGWLPKATRGWFFRAEAGAQVVMATHSPILMALPGATLLEVTHRGFRRVALQDTGHFRLYQSFTADPDDFVANALRGDD